MQPGTMDISGHYTLHTKSITVSYIFFIHYMK